MKSLSQIGRLKAKPPKSLSDAWTLLREGFDLLHTRPARVKSGPLPGGCSSPRQERRARSPRPADLEMLAAGRRRVRDAADRLHAGPRLPRRSQHRHVPHSGVRRSHDRDAQAAAQGRRAPRETLSTKRAKADAGTAGSPVRGDPGHALLRGVSLMLTGVSTNPCSRDSCAKSRCGWSSATIDSEVFAHLTVNEGHRPDRNRCAGSDRLAITPAFTRRSTITRRSTSHASRTAATRFIRRRSSASRRWRISTGQASARLFLPVFKMNFPDRQTAGAAGRGCFSANLVFVSIRKLGIRIRYSARSCTAWWGMGQDGCSP